MTEASEEATGQAVMQALERFVRSPSGCAEMMRQAGEGLARLTSHDRAAQVHARLSRRHAERAARCWRP